MIRPEDQELALNRSAHQLDQVSRVTVGVIGSMAVRRAEIRGFRGRRWPFAGAP